MPRTLDSVVRVMGPFLGVNESVADDIQPPQYASTLKNVVLNRGMIEARPGLRNVLEIEDPDVPVDAVVPWINAISVLPYAFRDGEVGPYISNGRVLIATSEQGPFSTLYITKPFTRTITKYRTVGRMPGLSREARGDVVHLGDRTFIAFPDWDRPRVVKWYRDAQATPSILGNGLDLNAAGFELASEVFTVEAAPSSAAEQFPLGRYAFAITYYDAGTGTESNGHYVYGRENFIEVGPDQKMRFNVFFTGDNTDPNTARVGRVRIYAIIERMDEDPNAEVVGGETAYRLIAEMPISPTQRSMGSAWVVVGRDDVRIPPIVPAPEALSLRGIGPYVPTRNGTPPKSNAIVVYDDKVCYASIDPDSYGALFYSADGNGEYVAADAFIAFDDEGSEPITGLMVYQGRLLVFKETGIHVITGTLNQMTNDDVALGNPAPQPLFSKFRAQSDTGCYNKNGGSLALKECDGVLYFNAFDGIYGFDGLRAQKVSDPIRTTHALVSEARRGSCSMANDRRTGVLWIAYAQERFRVFCFDYRQGVGDPSVGNWTIHDFPAGLAVVADAPSAIAPVLSADPLILVGTGSEPSRLLEMLQSQRGKDHTVAGDDRYVQWYYETPWMSLGLLDRAKRIHHVTVFYGPGIERTLHLSVQVERERNRVVFGRSLRMVDATNKPSQKIAVNRRGMRIKLVLESDNLVDAKCLGPFTGFAIDAEPIGRR